MKNPFASASVLLVFRLSEFGLVAGAAYPFRKGAAAIEWDSLNSNPQVGIGYAIMHQHWCQYPIYR